LTRMIFLLSIFAFFTTMITILAEQSSSPLTASTLDEEDSSSPSSSSTSSNCIRYDPEERIITVGCKSANLTDINNQVKDPEILHKDDDNNRVWVLNAGIIVSKNATLYINSTDTSWLKIIADGERDTTHSIHVSGSLKIDSIKLTSWNPSSNKYATSQDSDRNGQDLSIGNPRPYIIVEEDATGTTDIMNSEIAYLGYESGYGGGRTGLRYEGGDGSILQGNNIHHLYFAFYSIGVGDIIMENNHIHHNIYYGIDPHSGTHDMIIRNNTVHDNGSIGIICSLDCYSIIIEGNKVYNNTKMGIMFSRNMYDSIARNNFVSNEDIGIVISESHDNEIYDNTVSESGRGIEVDKDSFENIIHNNTIINIARPSDAIAVQDNGVYNNTIINIARPSDAIALQ
jgi:poly(beta-D-mannuronate) C5 epimerase